MVEIKHTSINDSIKALFSNIYNIAKIAGFDSKTIDNIYLQNIVMKNKTVYIPNRRFKIELTARIIIKDQFTQYINPH